MDITRIPNNQLQILWETSGRNPILKQQIEAEFKNRTSKYNGVFREYFFNVNFIQSDVVPLTFIPGSEAQKLYGSNISVYMILDEEGMAEMITNIQQKVETFGMVKSKKLANPLDPQQIVNLEKIGFHTADVMEVMRWK